MHAIHYGKHKLQKTQNKMLQNTVHLPSLMAHADLEAFINELSVSAVTGASLLLVVLVGLAVFCNKKWPALKLPLFALIVTITLGTTLTISGATVYLNVSSATGGPVHWHADVEFWACGNELEIRDPQGLLSNKIGTPTLHEHNDKRIHLEGVPVTLPHDASLGKFMNVIGGEISDQSLRLPLNEQDFFEDGPEEVDGDGPGAPQPGLIDQNIITDIDGTYANFVNGQLCGDQASEAQVFAYRFNSDSKTYTQTKVSQPELYQIAAHSEVPPGDCIIVEFAPLKDRTDKLCEQYGVRDQQRCEQFGVKAVERRICENTEVQ
jgi:hypothetical protein